MNSAYSNNTQISDISLKKELLKWDENVSSFQ